MSISGGLEELGGVVEEYDHETFQWYKLESWL